MGPLASAKEVVQLLSIAFAGVYEHESLSLQADFDVLRGEEEKVVSQ